MNSYQLLREYDAALDRYDAALEDLMQTLVGLGDRKAVIQLLPAIDSLEFDTNGVNQALWDQWLKESNVWNVNR